MKNTNTFMMKIAAAIFGAGIVALLAGLAVAPVAAQVGVNARLGLGANAGIHASTTDGERGNGRMSSTTRQQNMDNRQDQAVGKIDTSGANEINARITSLNGLSARLNAMKNLSSGEKSTLSGEIASLITELTGLQTKIQVDASSTVVGTVGAVGSSSPLRQDFASITKDYRVYALVIPQTQILAAADRINTLVTSLTTLSAKLQTRITAAQSAGASATVIATLQADLTDLNTQSVNAQTQATAAVNAVTGLMPDNGNATIAASNKAALEKGRSDIQTAATDIAAADKDAHMIVSGVEGLGGASGSVSASTSATVSTQ